MIDHLVSELSGTSVDNVQTLLFEEIHQKKWHVTDTFTINGTVHTYVYTRQDGKSGTFVVRGKTTMAKNIIQIKIIETSGSRHEA